jgi:glycosyltransferase involved in cell wall biosynthesis
MTEIVYDGENGLLVESGNPQALADALIKILEDDELRMQMGQNGYSRIDGRFSWQNIAETLWGQYSQLVPSGSE